jgi:hypothetical protein
LAFTDFQAVALFASIATCDACGGGRDALGGVMIHLVQRTIACLLVAGLAACAGAPEIPFDHASNAGIKNIAVIEPAMSPTPTILLASDIGQSFGLIGGLIDLSMQSNRDTKFAALLSAQGVKPDAVFLQDVHAALAAHGYNVVDTAQARSGNDLLKVYPKVGQPGVDAYLDLAVFNYGYVAAGIGDSTPYRPFLTARCRLVRASDGAVLMEDTIAYNPIGPVEKAVTLSPDPNFSFKDFDTLTADPGVAVKGLNTALTASANSIGTLVQ